MFPLRRDKREDLIIQTHPQLCLSVPGGLLSAPLSWPPRRRWTDVKAGARQAAGKLQDRLKSPKDKPESAGAGGLSVPLG